MMETFNLESGMPTVDQAERLLEGRLRRAKQEHLNAVKVIHGYGSSGTGGKIKKAIPGMMAGCIRRGFAKGFIRGEDFSIFNAETRAAFSVCPELRKDSDLERFNSGITIVLL